MPHLLTSTSSWFQAMNSDGQNTSYWHMGTVSYTVMCIACNFHLFIHTRHWNCITHWLYWLTLISWPVFAFIYCAGPCIILESPYMFWVFMHLVESPSFYLVVLLLVIVCLLPDFLILTFRRHFFPHAYQVIQEIADTEEYQREHPQTGR